MSDSTVVITLTTSSVRTVAKVVGNRLGPRTYISDTTISVDGSPPRSPLQVENGWTDEEFAAYERECEAREREYEARHEALQQEWERRTRRHRSMLEALDLGEVVNDNRVELGLGFSITVHDDDQLRLHVPPTDRRQWGTTRPITPEEAQRIFRDLNLASMLGMPDDEAAARVAT